MTNDRDRADSAPVDSVLADSIKLHRRSLHLAGGRYTTLALRPADAPIFAIGTDGDGAWHLTGNAEALLELAQLCWAAAMQRHERTLVVIGPDRTSGTDGSPRAVVMLNGDLGVPTAEEFDELAAALPWATPSEGTVKLVTRGLGRATAEGSASAVNQRWLAEVAGLLVLSAPEAALRDLAVGLSIAATRRPSSATVPAGFRLSD